MSELEDTLKEFSLPSRMAKVEERMGKAEQALEKKVDWNWFFGTLLVMIGLQITVFSAIWTELRTMRESIEETSSSVSAINGKLQPFDFILDDK